MLRHVSAELLRLFTRWSPPDVIFAFSSSSADASMLPMLSPLMAMLISIRFLFSQRGVFMMTLFIGLLR